MNSVEVHKFPLIEEPHLVTIKDKTRNSGLTSVCFVDQDRVLCADFNDKRVYLASIRDGALEILDTHPTVNADSDHVQTDLMDYHDGRFVVSNFYQGSVSIYRLEGDKICFDGELNHNDYIGLHGVRFIPGHPGLLWITYCGVKNKCHQIIDIETKEVIHHIDTDQKCQDVAFVDGRAVVFARTDHIKEGSAKARLFSKKWWMYASAYIYEVPSDLRNDAPKFLNKWKGKGHIDACKSHNGEIYAANQYLDRVDVFALSAKGKLSLNRTIKGMEMPHGLDLYDGKLAVTNYGDQTLRVMELN